MGRERLHTPQHTQEKRHSRETVQGRAQHKTLQHAGRYPCRQNYTHIDKHTNTQTNTHTQTHTQIHTHRYTHTDTHLGYDKYMHTQVIWCADTHTHTQTPNNHPRAQTPVG